MTSYYHTSIVCTTSHEVISHWHLHNYNYGVIYTGLYADVAIRSPCTFWLLMAVIVSVVRIVMWTMENLSGLLQIEISRPSLTSK